MSQEIKVGIATVTIPIGPFVTSEGTAVTAFTLSAGDFRLSKNGGAYASKNHTASAVHMANGWFGMLLNATDLGTLGRLDIHVAAAGGGIGKLPVWKELQIVTSNYWAIKGVAGYGVAQGSTVAGVAQASTVAGVAQASVVAGVAQASSVTAIGPARGVELSDFPFFMKKNSDHITPLTSVSPVGRIKKDSGAFVSLTNAVAEVASYGMYVVTVTSTEMTADKITFIFTAAGADQVELVIITT